MTIEYSWNELMSKVRALSAEVISLQERKEIAYAERNQVAVLAAKLASHLGYPFGIARHQDDGTDWGDWTHVLFIDLLTGQVSWHLRTSEAAELMLEGFPKYEGTWDGHTTDDKYERCRRFQ